MDRKKIFLWGAGKMLPIVLDTLDIEKVDLVGIIDSDLKKKGDKSNGLEIFPPDILNEVIADEVLVTAKNYESIKADIMQSTYPVDSVFYFWDKNDVRGYVDKEKRESLFLSEELEIKKLRLEHIPYANGTRPIPKIKSASELLQKILDEGCSLARYGDGEFEIMLGNDRPWFQEKNEGLANRLKEVINSQQEGFLIAIADCFGNLDKYNKQAQIEILKYVGNGKEEKIIKLLNLKQEYWDAYVSRAYLIYSDKSHASRVFNGVKEIFKNRKIVMVENEYARIGVGNDIFEKVAKVERIICPHKNVFDIYDDILTSIEEKAERDSLILISLGPTATVLAYDLFKAGYQALDIGQIDNEYEWYRMGVTKRAEIKGKSVAELSWCHTVEAEPDKEYEKQVIWRWNEKKEY